MLCSALGFGTWMPEGSFNRRSSRATALPPSGKGEVTFDSIIMRILFGKGGRASGETLASAYRNRKTKQFVHLTLPFYNRAHTHLKRRWCHVVGLVCFDRIGGSVSDGGAVSRSISGLLGVGYTLVLDSQLHWRGVTMQPPLLIRCWTWESRSHCHLIQPDLIPVVNFVVVVIVVVL